MSETKALKLTNFSKNYGEKSIFEDVNFSFEKGKVYALLSPNGFGKTTLMKCISGLITSYEGLISYGENVVEQGNLNDVIVFSPAIPLFEHRDLKVIDYVRQFCLLRELDFSKVLFDFMNSPVSKFSESKCSSLSTGEKKILQIFLDLATNAEFIMFDEPLNGLDHSKRKYLISKISSLATEGKTVVFSTHILSDVENILDEAVIINKDKKFSSSSEDFISTYERIFPENE